VGIAAAATFLGRMIGVVLLFHVARIATTAAACGIRFLACLHCTRVAVATARVHCTATLSLFLLIGLLAGRLRKTYCDYNQNHSDQNRKNKTSMGFHFLSPVIKINAARRRSLPTRLHRDADRKIRLRQAGL
jgi:hypothetical protein